MSSSAKVDRNRIAVVCRVRGSDGLKKGSTGCSSTNSGKRGGKEFTAGNCDRNSFFNLLRIAEA